MISSRAALDFGGLLCFLCGDGFDTLFSNGPEFTGGPEVSGFERFLVSGQFQELG